MTLLSHPKFYLKWKEESKMIEMMYKLLHLSVVTTYGKKIQEKSECLLRVHNCSALQKGYIQVCDYTCIT